MAASTGRTLFRAFVRGAGRRAQHLIADVKVSGVENIPSQGPLLLLFNHLSILDGPLVIANVPHEVEFVGPGDFTMTPSARLFINAYGVSLINRGRADRGSLKAMLTHLKAGRMLAMAPDGGTWEKDIFDVKPGAAYVSQMTGAPMIPIALGGFYGAEDAIPRGKRPRMSIRFGELMPAVPPSKDRRNRDADLEAASRDIMQRIYDMLPPEDQALYDRFGREAYDLVLDFVTEDGGQLAYNGPPLPDMSALAEFMIKPNLFKVMWQNAHLAVEPFVQPHFFAPIEIQISARALYDTLSHGEFDAYLQYRFDEDFAVRTLAALEAVHRACDWAMSHHARLRLRPIVKNA